MSFQAPGGSIVTPGGSYTSAVYTQLAFDPRMNKQPMLRGPITTGNAPVSGFAPVSGLAHGYIVQAQSQSAKDGTLYGCAFQFNPSIVTLQHGIDSNSSLVLPQYRRLAADTGVYVIGLASTLDLSLFFDRTYELNTGVLGPKNTGPYTPYNPLGSTTVNGTGKQTPEGADIARNEDPRLIGALADVHALYRVVGMTAQLTDQTWTDDNGRTDTATLTGPMQQVPCYLLLGSYMGNYAPYWYGYIDSIGVTYSHFTQQEVPMRAQVDIEFTLLPQQS